MIPKQLQNPEFRFCLIRRQSKAPFEKEWQKKGYKYNDKKLLQHLKNGGNYGVIGGYGDLRILDIDDKTKIEQFKKEFENTFLVETGNKGLHLYFISEYNTNHVLKDNMGEFRANNYQVVGTGSLHPNGEKYKTLNNNPIVNLPQEMLGLLLKPYLRKELPTTEIKDKPTDKSRSGLEYRKVLALLREGKTREQIFKQMLAYSKWKEAPKQYREMTYEKAKQFVELAKEEIMDSETLKKELKKVYNDIIGILKRFCDLKEEQYSLVALWIIGTYVYEEFETYPYLFFNAMRGSGKTRILKLIASLSNNGELIGSLSEAVLFRTAKGRTMCIDEFERVGSKEKQSLRELLNVAYKKGQVIKRMKKKKTIDGEDFVVEEFEVYTPISMANIWGMEEVLEDRCISLILEKSNNPAIVKLIEDFSRNEAIKNITTLFSKGKCSLCSLFHKTGYEYNWNNYIIKKYPTTQNTPPKTTPTTHNTLTTNTTLTTQLQEIDTSFFDSLDKSNIQGRHLELSFPLFAISKFIGVFDQTLKTIKKIMEEKKLEDITESKDVQVYDFVSISKETNFTFVSNLTKEFRNFLDIGEKDETWVNSRWFGRALKRLVLIKEKRRKSKGIEVILNIEKAKEKIKMFKEPEKIEQDKELPIKYEKIDSVRINDEKKGNPERG